MKLKFLLIVFVLASCKLSENHQEKTPKYFEGTVEYQIEYESLNDDYPLEKMTPSLPKKMTHSYKNGNWVNEYFLNETLVKRSWYNRSTNLNYYHSTGSDTLYYSDPSITDFNVDAIQQIEGEQILDLATKKVKILCSGKKGTGYENNQNKLEMHASLELPVNPDWYQNNLEFGYDKTMRLAPGVSLKTEFVIFNYQKTTTTATKIEWEEVELDLSVDSTKVFIKI